MPDTEPPLNGRAFADFAQFMDFRHRQITPEHPQANGMADKFIVSVGKTTRSALAKGKDWRTELQAFLRSYRSTPHRTTGIAPSEALFEYNRTSRLPHVSAPGVKTRERELLEELQRINDRNKKERAKQYTDLKRKAAKHNFKIGEKVLLRQKRLRKSMTRYADRDLTVVAIKTSMITVEDADISTITRDASQFKRLNFMSIGDGRHIQPEISETQTDPGTAENGQAAVPNTREQEQ